MSAQLKCRQPILLDTVAVSADWSETGRNAGTRQSDKIVDRPRSRRVYGLVTGLIPALALATALAVLTSRLEAAQCTASFPDGAQTVNNNGSIVFNNNAQLFNSWDNVLDTWSITDNNTNTCFGTDCTEANTGALALAPGAFLVTASTTDVTVPNNGSATLTQAQYDDVTVGNGALLTTTASITEYRMDNLTINQNAVVRLTAGNYWIDTLSMGNGSRIEVTGTGTVRLFINDAVSGLGNNVILNPATAPITGSQFFLYGYSNLTFGNDMQLNGVVYGAGNITSGQNNVITGAITAANSISFGNGTQMRYDETTVVNADLGTLCRKASTGPYLEWRFEQNSWSGTSGEVLDEGANNQDGTALNGAQTQNATPAINTDPGTCRYGDFVAASNQSVQIGHNSVQNLDNSMTVTAWIRLRSYNSGGLRSFLSKDSNYEMHVNSTGRVNWWWQNQAFGNTADYFSNATVPLNTWTHVAFRFRPGQQRFFINGAIDTATLSWNGRMAADTDPLQIGQDQGFAGRYWDGLIDEVRIYDRPLSDAEILAVKNETHPCPITVHHYQLEHDGSGLTCTPEPVTLKACSDAACTTQYSGSYSVTLTPTGWVGGDSKSLTGSPQSLSLWHTSPGTVTLGISASSPAPQSALQCVGGSGNACDLVFADTGFLFSVPDVAANKPSGLFNVSAVRKSDNALLCVPAFQNTSRTLQFYSNYSVPATGTLSVSLRPASAGSFTTIATSAPGTDIPLTFDNSGVAQVEMRYADAGQLNLNASYTGSAGTGDAGLVMTGADSFVSLPAGYCIQPMQLLTPTSPYTAACNDIGSCSVYQRAGRDFPLRVQAMQWVSDSETDTAFCDNALTPNFRTTDAGTAYTLTPTMVEASKNSDGALGVGALTIGSGGQVTIANQSLSEVGRFHIGIANSSTYLGINVAALNSNAASRSAVFGRIAPEAFVVSIDDVGGYQQMCSGSFTYAGVTDGGTTTGKAGQVTPTTLSVRAVNALTPATTTINYASNVIDANGITYARLHGSIPPLTPAPSTTGIFSFTSVLNFVAGLSNQNVNDLQYQYYAGNAPANNAPVNIAATLTVTDADAITGTGASAARAFRLGRMVLENAYGPEQLPLPIPLRAEYFDGTRWRRNSADSCSSYAAAAVTRDLFTGTLSSSETEVESPIAAQTLANGIAQTTQPLRLEAPGLGENGSLRITLTVPSWLQFDWDSNGLHTDPPQATATFGRYRGSDRVIYWREQLPVIP